MTACHLRKRDRRTSHRWGVAPLAIVMTLTFTVRAGSNAPDRARDLAAFSVDSVTSHDRKATDPTTFEAKPGRAINAGIPWSISSLGAQLVRTLARVQPIDALHGVSSSIAGLVESSAWLMDEVQSWTRATMASETTDESTRPGRRTWLAVTNFFIHAPHARWIEGTVQEIAQRGGGTMRIDRVSRFVGTSFAVDFRATGLRAEGAPGRLLVDVSGSDEPFAVEVLDHVRNRYEAVNGLGLVSPERFVDPEDESIMLRVVIGPEDAFGRSGGVVEIDAIVVRFER